MKVYRDRFALVGISTDKTPVGRWVKLNIDGKKYHYFSIGRRRISAKKPLIPERLRSLLELWRYRKKIDSLGLKYAFIQAPELLIVVAKWNLESICYRFPGVENPLAMPRYAWGKLLAKAFDRRLFAALQKTDITLACADETSIRSLINRSDGNLLQEQVKFFPTRVDTTIYFPQNKEKMRRELNLPTDCHIIVSSGRISRVKGWDLILKAYHILAASEVGTYLIFVGDGEDREKLDRQIIDLKLTDAVQITGFQQPNFVAKYLNASDVVVIGSHKEGWSMAMLEALACGKAIVSTAISGAHDMVHEGKNGYIVENREPVQFAQAISQALELFNPDKISVNIANKYSLKTLKKDLGTKWKPLS
jgi:glycosyltransferase involved in cell wall biosynthesis